VFFKEGKIAKHPSEAEKRFLGILEELPEIDPRIEQVSLTTEGDITVKTTAGTVTVHVKHPKKEES